MNLFQPDAQLYDVFRLQPLTSTLFLRAREHDPVKPTEICCLLRDFVPLWFNDLLVKSFVVQSFQVSAMLQILYARALVLDG